MKPRVSILNPKFEYVHSTKTDISIRIKAEQERLKNLKKSKVMPIQLVKKQGS